MVRSISLVSSVNWSGKLDLSVHENGNMIFLTGGLQSSLERPFFKHIDIHGSLSFP